MENKANIKPYIRQFYRNNQKYLFFAVLQTIFLTATNLLISWLIQQIVDISTGKDTGFTFSQIVLLCLGAVCIIIFTSGLSYISKPKFISKAIGQYQNYVFSELSKKGITAFSGENTALYTSALSNDINSIENGYLSNIFTILDQLVLFVGALGLMFYYSPLLTAISIMLAILPILAAILTGNQVAAEEKKVSIRNESYMGTLHDALSGFSVIKSFRAEAHICRLFAKGVKDVTDSKERKRKKSIIVSCLSSITAVILQFGVFLAGTWLIISGSDLSAGSVLVFLQLLNYVVNPINIIPQALAECKASKALIAKLDVALNSNVRAKGTKQKSKLTYGIRVENLSFGYEEGKSILQNINFTFEAGKSYCLVGASGSGKSTLLNLLMASSNNFVGTIAYDSINISEIAEESLYDMVSLVQQNVFVFNASIRDNITMFSPFPEAEITRAIELSGLSSLIAQRGEGYLCGENGIGLSGGEKQRISIARSLLRKSQILLVDEATAALDPQTTYQVSSAILGLDGLTRIVITHTLDKNLLSQYGCILTMKNGNIVESGTFAELTARKGYFYSLYTVSQ